MKQVDPSGVIKSASVISSAGGVALKPKIEAPQPSVIEPPRPPRAPTITGPQPAYSIEQAVALLQSLPQGGRNRDLVYQVVKTTLQSLNVEIEQIVGDAQRKEGEFNAQLKTLDDQIAEFEAQIKAKRREAQGLRQQAEQIKQVRLQLEQADQRSGSLPKQQPAKPGSGRVAISSQPAKAGAFHALGLFFSSLFASLAKLAQPKPDTSQPQQPRAEAAAPAAASPSTPEQSDAPAAPSALAA